MMPRKRRGRGEGSVYQRADGLWVGSVSEGYKVDGSRNRRTAYGKTKREVQQKLRELGSDKAITEGCDVTLGNYLSRWLENTVRQASAPTTYNRYEQIVRLHIVPHLGQVKLAKLAPTHIEQLFVRLQRDKVGGRTRQMSGTVLHTALANAVALKLIGHNPAGDVRKPRHKSREMTVWDANQSRRFLEEASKDRFFALYAVAIATGLRQGELLALLWRDIDFEHAAVSVTKALEEVAGKLRVKEAKTSKGRRRVTLPRFAIAALQEHRKSMLAAGHMAAPVFCDTGGGYVRKSNVRRRSYLPILARAGLPVIRFHDLRHTAATLLLLEGEHPKVVSERLGHASVQITLDTYSHVLPTMQKAAAENSIA